mmetsp:Transcript_14948/g.16625  ORF Transcript_14948/g.16625 Transcript_14948/m.16625 type:complete len:610 (+) Transcript_14948:75-1904(+)
MSRSRDMTTNAPPLPHQWQLAWQVVVNLMEKRESWPFNQPVDPVALGIPSYPKLIKKPMDLGSVKKNIEAQKFKSLREFAAAVRLVWSNAKKFNDKGTAIHTSAVRLGKQFEASYRELQEQVKMNQSGDDSFLMQDPQGAYTPDVGSDLLDLVETVKRSEADLQMLKKQGLARPPVEAQPDIPHLPKKRTDPEALTYDEKLALSQAVNGLQYADHHLGVVLLIEEEHPEELTFDVGSLKLDIDKMSAQCLRRLEVYVKNCARHRPASAREPTPAPPTTQPPSVQIKSTPNNQPRAAPSKSKRKHHKKKSRGDDSSSSSDEDSSDSSSSSSGSASDTEVGGPAATPSMTMSSVKTENTEPTAMKVEPALDSMDVDVKPEPITGGALPNTANGVTHENAMQEDTVMTDVKPPNPLESVPEAPKIIDESAAAPEKVEIANPSSWSILGQTTPKEEPAPSAATDTTANPAWNEFTKRAEQNKQREKEREEIEKKMALEREEKARKLREEEEQRRIAAEEEERRKKQAEEDEKKRKAEQLQQEREAARAARENETATVQLDNTQEHLDIENMQNQTAGLNMLQFGLQIKNEVAAGLRNAVAEAAASEAKEEGTA